MSESKIQRLPGNRVDGKSVENSGSGRKGSLELGVVWYFGGKNLVDSGSVAGWAEPESEHNWNDGYETVFQTVTEDPMGPCAIEFGGEPFINEKCPRQDVILHVNGFYVGSWRLTKASAYTLVARVEREQLLSRGQGVLLRLVWSFPDSASPFARGLSNDYRELAFCFRSILISKSLATAL